MSSFGTWTAVNQRLVKQNGLMFLKIVTGVLVQSGKRLHLQLKPCTLHLYQDHQANSLQFFISVLTELGVSINEFLVGINFSLF